MIKRTLDLTCYNKSFFLFGPRQTGKTSLVRSSFKPDLFIDLLKMSEFLKYSKDPSLFGKEVQSLSSKKPIVVVDEIQRCADLLNEIHSLLEERSVQFILTGSSARKLRQKGVNLLGGRALTYNLFPLTHIELQEKFSLEEVLHYGSLPAIALEQNQSLKKNLLKSYVEIYLKEEVQQEAVTRNIPAFARFLELAGFENGHILNWSTMAREVGVHATTIKEYFQILEDTLLGFHLGPYSKSVRTKIVSHPKFYFFDTGIVTTLQRRLDSIPPPKSPSYGDSFEHWVILETRRLLSYRQHQFSMTFFRTTDGAEVDLILEKGNEVWAVEIKSSETPALRDIKGLRSFLKDHQVQRAICVCQAQHLYREGKIEFMPWKSFFEEL